MRGGMAKKILLTGCCGFIASRVGQKLLNERNCEVLGVDELNDYYDVRLKQWRLAQLKKNRNFTFIRQDIASPEMAGIVKEFAPDAIVNLAARAGVRASITDPFIYFRANLAGTLNLLESAKELGVKKFILSSTSSVYAGEEMPFSESLAVNRPISPYAASKKSAEAVCYTYHYLYGINVTVFRYFTVYGPAGRPDMSIFKFIKLIDQGEPITVYGDGTQERDFTYVEDIAEGTVRGLDIEGFNTINLGGNHPYSLNELIAFIEQELGKEAVRIAQPFQKTDIYATWADIGNAERLLKWHPETTLEEGVRKTVEWYKENRNWVKDIALVD